MSEKIEKTEPKAVENVINKVNLYIKRSQITLHQFASNVGYTYQTLYRLLNQRFLPSITSLQTIATFFNCTISELTHDNIFIDIPIYADFQDFLYNKAREDTVRIYLPYKDFLPIFDKDFFAIKNSFYIDKQYLINNLEINLNLNCCQIFYKTDKIPIDGYYYVEHKLKKKVLNIVSVARTNIIVDFEGSSVNLPISDIVPIACYVNTAFFPNYKMQYLECATINKFS